MSYKFTFLCYRMLSLLLLFFVFPESNYALPDNGKKAAVKKVFYGKASFYANKFVGRKTASGEIFSQTKMTCACNAVKIGTWLRVTNVRNNKSVLVKVNDRIHPRMQRVVDLTSGAAKKIGITSSNGVGRVKVEVLGKHRPDE